VGDFKESLSMLRLAVKIAPENSTNHLYLAKTLMELGKDRDACVELDRALAANCHATSPEGLSEDHRQANRQKLELHCGAGKNPESVEILRIPEPGSGGCFGNNRSGLQSHWLVGQQSRAVTRAVSVSKSSSPHSAGVRFPWDLPDTNRGADFSLGRWDKWQQEADNRSLRNKL
jgi:hypothetical protein